MTSTQTRLTLAAAVATLLASLTLAPLVQGGGWFLAVFVVTAVVGGVGAAGRRVLRLWPLVLPAQLLVLAIVLTWLFARDLAVLGLLPGADVLAEMRALVDEGLSVTRKDAPPVTAAPGVILLVTAGIGVVAVVVDMIAASLRRPAVAGLPLLAVYCVPAAVLPGGLSWWYFVPAALGFLVLVGSDSVDRIRGWGRVLGPAGDDRGDRALGGPLAGARRLAAGCVLLSAMVPVFVPGLGEQLLGGGHGNGPGKDGSITVFNPIVKLRDKLNDRANIRVAVYSTPAQRPEPLRIAADELFTGNSWEPVTGKVPRDNRVQDVVSPPGLTEGIPRQTVRSQIKIDTLDRSRLSQSYLPLPYPWTSVDIQGSWLYDARSLNVVGDGVTATGASYTVEHLLLDPTPAQLQNAPSPPLDVLQAFTALPKTLSPLIGRTAERVGGDGTPYQQAVRLQEWLRSDQFHYDANVDPPDGKDPSGADGVTWFLQSKRGYCVQFASTMAVMARWLKIPARVAVGFLVSRPPRTDGTYDVTLPDAHAWPELYFGGIGWVRFEPTPALRTGAPPAWAQPATPEPSASATATATAPAQPSQSASARPKPQRPDPADAAEEPPLFDRIMAAIPWRWLAVLLGLLLLGGVPLAVELLVRRRRWSRAARGTPTARVEAAWDELRDRLGDLGVGWAVSWTPRALQLRLVADHGLPGSAQAALGRLVADLEHVRYAPPDGAGRDVVALRADVTTVVRAVAASDAIAPRVRRRARWLPASGLRELGNAVRRVDVAADQAGRRVSALGADVRRRVGSRR